MTSHGTFYYSRGGYRQATHMAIHEECRTQGCKYVDACAKELDAMNLKALSEGKGMSQALWCDQHNGPFSAKDPDQSEFTKKVKKYNKRLDAYEDKFEVFTLCGECAARFQVGTTTTTAIEAPLAQEDDE